MAFLLGLPLLLLILIGVVVLFLHFLPTFVAGSRRANNFWWIFLVNLLFGWTLIGWVVALVWALRDTPRFSYRYVPPPYNR
ncbi:MAG: superinfection immunity protein [Acidobacteriaceae bacterium]